MSAMNLPAAAAPSRKWPLVLGAAIVALAIGAFAGMQFLATSEPAPVVHAMIPPPPGHEFDIAGGSPGPARISPDGTMIAFSALDQEGQVMLWLRHVAEQEATMLSGTLEAAYPFWSPDSQTIGFFELDEGRLRKVSAAGGPPTTLCPAPNGKGGTWNEDGLIIFAPDAGIGLSTVRATGGEATELTTVTDQDNSHRHPRFMPDGEHYLFLARTNDSTVDGYQIRMGRLGSEEVRALTTSEAAVEYGGGHLLTVREQVLMATPFPSPWDGELIGGVPLVERIAVLGQNSAIAVYSVSDDGVLVFQTGSPATDRILTRKNLETNQTLEIGEAGAVNHPRVSPDGTLAVVEIRGEGDTAIDLWLVDLETGLRTRLSFAAGDETRAIWTPDGSAVIYTNQLDSTWQLLLHSIEGNAVPIILAESDQQLFPSSVHPSGSSLLVDVQGASENSNDVDIGLMPLQENSQPEIFLDAGEGFGAGGMYSPDGRWIAYHASSEQGADVFVVSADNPARKWQVTRVGAVWPQWADGGTALYTSRFDGTVYRTEVNGSGDTFRVGASVDGIRSAGPSGDGSPFSLHPDGEHVFQSSPETEQDSSVSPLHLVTDWKRGLMR